MIHRWHVRRALRSAEVIDASARGRNGIRKMASFSVPKPQCSGYEVHIYPPRLTQHDTESCLNKSPHHTFTVCKKRKVYFPSCASVSWSVEKLPVRINHLTIHLPYVPRMQISKNHYMVQQSKLTRKKLLYRSSGIHSAEQTSLHYGNRRPSRCKHRGRTKAFGSHHSTLLSLEFPSPLHSSSKTSQVLGIGVPSKAVAFECKN